MNKHSKRNKSKDNPYTLGFDEIKNVYVVEFKDCKQINQKVEVNKEVYEAFDNFEWEYISQKHKYRKHIKHSEVYDYTLYKRAIKREKDVFELVEQSIMNEKLREAISHLTEVQKRRIKMYFFDNLTLEQISKVEGCSVKNIHKSIEQAKINLKKNLKK